MTDSLRSTPVVPETLSEKCPTCAAPVVRIRGTDNGLEGAAKIASPDRFEYAPSTQYYPPAVTGITPMGGSFTVRVSPAPIPATPPASFEEMLDEFADAVRDHTTGSGPKERQRLEKPIAVARAAILSEWERMQAEIVSLRLSLAETEIGERDAEAMVENLTAKVHRLSAASLTADEAQAILDQPVSLAPELIYRLRRISSTGGSTREEK